LNEHGVDYFLVAFFAFVSLALTGHLLLRIFFFGTGELLRVFGIQSYTVLVPQ
jgi:hypothetical protein